MFYTDKPDFTNLRFGDVIQGFVGVIPIIETPFNDKILEGYEFQIKSFIPEFSVVMTHCCSIGKGNLALAPLKKIHHKIDILRLNSDIYNNFTALNRKIEKKMLIPKSYWDKMDGDEKTEIEMLGKGWHHIDKIFYDSNDLFTPYDIKLKDEEIIRTNSYIVDFSDIYNVKCSKIQKNNIDKKILKSKFLELTENAREEIKEKIATYFSRPAED